LSIHINEISDLEFRIAVNRIQTAILPIGSLEQHGEHLPISTDSLIIDYISTKIACEIQAFKLPVLSYGISYEHTPMFNLSLQSSTLLSALSDISCSLLEQGMKNIIILNGHHGNSGILPYISQNIAEKISRDSNIYILNYWQFMSDRFDHAGKVETSLLLAIAPDLVHMEKAKANTKHLKKSKIAYAAFGNSPGSFPRLTGNGVWGDPTEANAEKGFALLEEIISNTRSVLFELL
jgi:creatinine amidohydrolase